MGLAPYGTPAFLDQVWSLIQPLPGGQFRLDLRFFDFQSRARMYSPEFIELFGRQPRPPGSEIQSFHEDVARSLQVVLEELLLQKVTYLHERTGSDRLCMAGGVALNCVANGRIAREGPFRQLFVQPASSDAGGCVGAAAIAAQRLEAASPRPAALAHLCLGPSFGSRDVADLIDAAGLEATDYRERECELLDAVADRLARRQVVGWFHGRMEFGPRALGGRSILGDPRDPGMRARINASVKKREAFRPFAPAVRESRARDHFDLDHPSRFMLETCRVVSPLDLPAITHVDGSARVQTVDPRTSPRFEGLLAAFERRTGCPILLNTSFNMKDEPIVHTPVDALVCFIRSEMDALVLEDFVIDRAALRQAHRALFQGLSLSSTPAVSHSTYTLL